MRRVTIIVGALLLLWPLAAGAPVAAAAGFANPAFQQQWQQGEALALNFWGPLGTAHDGQQEPYADVQGGQRLVQFFDKGRMELTNGAVTNGLLAEEMVTGRVQVGNATFVDRPPPAIPIAGDPDTPGPTYAALASKAKGLFDAAPAQTGNVAQAVVSAGGDLSVGAASAANAATFTAYDAPTKHNVPRAFADYRGRAGLATIGYAIAEPFSATVKVAGVPRQVLVQVFERRVLTYTATNPAQFQVEMGNAGQHYYQWRYGAGAAPAAPAVTAPAPISTVTPSLNWSGYEVDTKGITAVHAAWTVPTVGTQPSTGYSATWVGIGGGFTDDLIQAGTEQDIENGVTQYYAWVEALPDDALGVSPRRLPAHPGDSFSVTITNTSGDNWTVTLENRTTGQQLMLTTTYTSCRCSAEWIEEVPQVNGNDNAPLGNFGTVTFTEATATINGVTKTAGAFGAQPQALKQGARVLAQPGPLGPDGGSFAVTFVR